MKTESAHSARTSTYDSLHLPLPLLKKQAKWLSWRCRACYQLKIQVIQATCQEAGVQFPGV